MKTLARAATAAVLIASISPAAASQICRGLTGWGRYDCLSQNQPDEYIRCNELGVARGYSNVAPGRASFIMACMIHAQRDRTRSNAKHWGCGARNENGS